MTENGEERREGTGSREQVCGTLDCYLERFFRQRAGVLRSTCEASPQGTEKDGFVSRISTPAPLGARRLRFAEGGGGERLL